MPQDKEYLLKEQTAEATYQKKLTAGQNIVISPNNVISALGSTVSPTTVTVTPKTLSGENIADMSVNGTTYHLYSSYPRIMTGATTASAGQSGYVPTPYSTDKDYVLYGSGEWKDPHVPVITANPAGSTTATLNKLYLDGTIYGIAGGGGGSGSTVSITPTLSSGTKIADYEIDGVSDSLYAPSDGGGSTGTDLLFSTDSAQSTMNLTNNLFLYDLIQLNIVDSNGYTRGVTFSPLTLQGGQVIGFDNTYGYSWNRIESGTQIVEVSRSNFYIASIVGLNPTTPISDAYLTNGLVGSSGGTYINCNLDKNMDNGVYDITLKDGATEYTSTIMWTGTITVSINGGAFKLEITQTTAGLTDYSGAWRDITCDIVRIA